jgi:hypothetical protein
MTSTAVRTTRPQPKPLPFYFDPIPDQAQIDVGMGKITALDAMVLGRCLRQRRTSGFAPGTECTKEKIGAPPGFDEQGRLIDRGGLGRCPRTIQRCFQRLKAAGWMEHLPDPHDLTGYRLAFPKLVPIRLAPGTETSAPGRRPCPPPGDVRVSPPPPHCTHAGDETRALETTTLAREAAAPAIAAEPSSSPLSLRSPEIPERPDSQRPRDTVLEAEQLEALVDRLMAVLAIVQSLAMAKIREWVSRYGLELVDLVLTFAELHKPTRKAVKGTGGIAFHLERWKSWDPAAIRHELGDLRPRPKPAAAPPPRLRQEPLPAAPDRAELEEIIGELVAMPRLCPFDADRLNKARKDLDDLDHAAGRDPEARPAP